MPRTWRRARDTTDEISRGLYCLRAGRLTGENPSDVPALMIRKCCAVSFWHIEHTIKRAANLWEVADDQSSAETEREDQSRYIDVLPSSQLVPASF